MTLKVSAVIRRENSRLKEQYDSDFTDWLTDVAKNAIENWTDGNGCLDEEAVVGEIENAVDDYEYFRRHND